MSDPRPAPRFEPSRPALGPLGERRARLLALGAGALLLALVASSVANTSRTSLRCVDGQLVAFRGSLMPAGEEPLDDPTLPALRVPAAACDDEELEGLDALRARHREISGAWVAEARPSEPAVLESSKEMLDAVAELPEDASDADRQRQREALKALVDAKVETARATRQEALYWIKQAQQAGVDPERMLAAERVLGVPAEPELSTPHARPEDPDQPEVALGATTARSL